MYQDLTCSTSRYVIGRLWLQDAARIWHIMMMQVALRNTCPCSCRLCAALASRSSSGKVSELIGTDRSNASSLANLQHFSFTYSFTDVLHSCIYFDQFTFMYLRTIRGSNRHVYSKGHTRNLSG